MTTAMLPLTALRVAQPSMGFVARRASSSASGPPASETPSPAPPPRRRRREAVPTEGVDLVAPPDSISNIRPIIYASSPSSSHTYARTPNSPYSTGEFPVSASSRAVSPRVADMELEWRLRRERVDAENHRFWASMNQQFSAQLAHRLSLLPPASDPPSAEDERRRQDCMAQFYADWQAAKRDEMGAWVKRWWGEVWDGVRVQGRIYAARLFGR